MLIGGCDFFWGLIDDAAKLLKCFSNKICPRWVVAIDRRCGVCRSTAPVKGINKVTGSR